MASNHLSPKQFPGLPYPRLREAYARATVHELGEARNALKEAMKATGMSAEELEKLAKLDGVPQTDFGFALFSKHPSVTYDMAQHGAAINTLQYMVSADPETKKQARDELMFGFRKRHTAIKSPHFSAMVN